MRSSVRDRLVHAAQTVVAGLHPCLESLAAHELGHVVHHRTRASKIAPYAWLTAYLLIAGSGLALMAVALLTGSQNLAGPAVCATAAAGFALLALQTAFARREELGADLFAIDTTRDLAAAEELMDHVGEPLPTGRVRRALTLFERRWL